VNLIIEEELMIHSYHHPHLQHE